MDRSHGVSAPTNAAHEEAGAFRTSVQRTIDVPAGDAFDAWAQASKLARWFTTTAEQDFREGGRYSNGDGDSGEFKRIVPGKLIRFTWEQKHHRPGSVVTVTFAPRGGSRSVVRITHSRLVTAADRDDLKLAWSWAADSLKSFLETGKPITWEAWETQHAAAAKK